ncbi:MAG TPA: uroporphyrinogen-III C-methyltransferase [Burkholderiales bacterium]|nr:uroporphyrinogen-III C-methyltransferase [Burkholderiales bacterium]
MGKVFLVGAGPGDPQLLTLKAARALREADLILMDDLASRGCLSHARWNVRVIEVGKRGGCPSTSQAFIEKLMIQAARAGQTVVRLKGGDPFVFGRGGEELERLRSCGIEVEVIPGVTAGIGAPAMLGIPVTHRALSHGVTFVTGHGADIDWAALVRSKTTLVVYMGLRSIEKISSALVAAGMDPATPACIIENGTLQTQKALVTTLDRLSGEGFTGPAVIVIGDVVRMAAAKAAAVEERAA